MEPDRERRRYCMYKAQKAWRDGELILSIDKSMTSISPSTSPTWRGGEQVGEPETKWGHGIGLFTTAPASVFLPSFCRPPASRPGVFAGRHAPRSL